MLTTLLEALPRTGVAVGVVLGMAVLGRLVGRGIRRRYLRRDRPSFANVMGRVVGLGATVLGVLAGLTIVFPTVKPVDVLGSLGFFSIAVGFAFRDILENLLAGMLLLFRAPFRTGDEVEIEGVRGRVEEINLRETAIRTYDGRRVLVPNSTVYKNPITVQTAYEAVRTEATVGVAYGTDLDRARDVALEALRGSEGVLADPAPLVLVGGLGVSTLDLQLLFWSAPRQAEVRRVTDRALAAVVDAYDEAGIEMPADVLVLQGSPSLKAALRDDSVEPTEGGSTRRAEP